MNDWTRAGANALVTGTIAAGFAALALAELARVEGKRALQPINATSHWLNGDQASSFREADAAHTLVGYATHNASAIFWAAPFERWLQTHAPRSWLELLGQAGVMSAIAAAVDYGATPQRFTPGWELVLSKRAMAVAYGALAAGLAVGAYIMNRDRWRLSLF